jgi:hypothetical protein
MAKRRDEERTFLEVHDRRDWHTGGAGEIAL